MKRPSIVPAAIALGVGALALVIALVLSFVPFSSAGTVEPTPAFRAQKSLDEVLFKMATSPAAKFTGKVTYKYDDERGEDSDTETFVAVRADIDNWRWAGVPFYLRTGKRLPTKCSEVVVYFKTPELNLFKETWQELPQNKLTIRLQPDEGVDIQVLNKVPGLDHKHNLQITKLDLSYSETFNQTHLADAYERLLLETMRGIQALFVRRDEVEEAWKWVDSITEAWAADRDSPKPYQAGTWGPVASVAMITRDGRSWNEFE